MSNSLLSQTQSVIQSIYGLDTTAVFKAIDREPF